MRVIVIDDSPSSLMAIVGHLRQVTGCEPAGHLDPLEALAACGREQFELVLIDYVMPKMNGIEVIAALRGMDAYRTVPIIMITSSGEKFLRRDAICAGASDVLGKPFDALELQARVRNLLALRQAQVELADRAGQLAREVAAATRHLAEREEEVIWRLARAIEIRDGTTGDHVSRVATIARLVAEGLGMDPGQVRNLYLAVPLHDIGKIGIPDAVLQKPGALTDAEMAEMRRHVDIGGKILDQGSSELVRVAAVIARTHHEKWDGSGYPRGLAGLDIPVEGRIAALADVFDALCSERPYKRAWPAEKAYEEILACSGRHFDPRCVRAFTRKWPEIRALFEAAGTDTPASQAA